VIVLEGTPGAGKTTLLGSMIERDPDRVVVFPEAQPERGATDEHLIAEALLAEDLDRTTWAHRLEYYRPGLRVLSDRCYIGVLAYRHAMWQSGRLPRTYFDRALEACLRLGLPDRHRRNKVFILITQPSVSIKRRAMHAGVAEFSKWFDLDFLEAYNAFLESTPGVFPENTVVVREVEEMWDLLTTRATGSTCPRCRSEPRSAMVQTQNGAVQLYASGLHIKQDMDEVCVGTARQLIGYYDRLPTDAAGHQDPT
jgi:thymidylate kinase